MIEVAGFREKGSASVVGERALGLAWGELEENAVVWVVQFPYSNGVINCSAISAEEFWGNTDVLVVLL